MHCTKMGKHCRLSPSELCTGVCCSGLKKSANFFPNDDNNMIKLIMAGPARTVHYGPTNILVPPRPRQVPRQVPLS